MGETDNRVSEKCQTCRWWQSDSNNHRGHDIIEPKDPDTWQPMALPFEVKHCKSPKITFYERPVEPDAATVIDGSEYYASLITGPEFGCVHWATDRYGEGVLQMTQPILKQAVTANRQGVFREWYAEQSPEIKKQLNDELTPIVALMAITAEGVSISEAFAVCGAIMMDGIVDGINAVTSQ